MSICAYCYTNENPCRCPKFDTCPNRQPAGSREERWAAAEAEATAAYAAAKIDTNFTEFDTIDD